MPPPVPARVNEGRMIEGRPTSSCAAIASSKVWATLEFGLSSPILSIASRNFCRSSALSITSARAPIISTPYLASTPLRSSSSETFSAVWPPMVGKSASGFSLAMICSTIAAVIGSM
jgi:hypothetical protein